jgi:hypothetical protein
MIIPILPLRSNKSHNNSSSNSSSNNRAEAAVVGVVRFRVRSDSYWATRLDGNLEFLGFREGLM